MKNIKIIALRRRQMTMTVIVIILCICSCNKENNDSTLTTTIGVELVDIIEPPGLPDIYNNSIVEPIVDIKNTNTEIINSLTISYLLVKKSKKGSTESGPITNWTGNLNPGEIKTITCSKWDTLSGNTPLENGKYLIQVSIIQVNGGGLLPGNDNMKEREFILEQ